MFGRILLFGPDGKLLERSPNTQMVTSGFAEARALGLGDATYKISKVYVEFENNAGAVTPPTFVNTEGRSYYTGLVAPRDYLRVDLLGAPQLSIVPGYAAYFTAGVSGNRLTFLAQTAGSAGENGVGFSNALNSTVFGVALVAAPDDSDKSKDVIVARGYYAVANQLKKPSGGQLTIGWELDFIPPP